MRKIIDKGSPVKVTGHTSTTRRRDGAHIPLLIVQQEADLMDTDTGEIVGTTIRETTIMCFMDDIESHIGETLNGVTLRINRDGYLGIVPLEIKDRFRVE